MYDLDRLEKMILRSLVADFFVVRPHDNEHE
jgi:hypothetical protein